jgi:hypothetical protein
MNFHYIANIAFALVLSLSLFAPARAQTPTPNTPLWRADFEEGDLWDWYAPCPNIRKHPARVNTKLCGETGGGEFHNNDGRSFARAVRAQAVGVPARSGRYVGELKILRSSGGVRLFRWDEAENAAGSALIYKAWYYIPERYSAPAWWNIWQWKSTQNGVSDPFFTLDVSTRGSDGAMRFRMTDWRCINKRITNCTPEYGDASIAIPVGRWFEVKALHSCRTDRSGTVVFWQDGVEILRAENVQTAYPGSKCNWSINNYNNDPKPANNVLRLDKNGKPVRGDIVIYIDDAEITPGT